MSASAAPSVATPMPPLSSTATAPAASAAVPRDVLSFAPMMEISDHHWRYLMRLITKQTKLYTEMIVDQTLLHTDDPDRFLAFDPVQHPIACQIGGNTPDSLARVAAMVESYGYDEVNLNVGCPSDRVAGAGCFGARLMLEPETVRDCLAAMRRAVSIPVTIKCRLGADSMDSYDAFKHFVEVVAESGVQLFIVHARKAWLKGLSPAQNRNVPPLHYDWVMRAAREFPHLQFSMNGGVKGLDAVHSWMCHDGSDAEAEAKDAPVPPVAADAAPTAAEASAGAGAGVGAGAGTGSKAEAPAAHVVPGKGFPGILNSCMIGRHASTVPWEYSDADRRLFGVPNPGLTRREVLHKYMDYIEAHSARASRPRYNTYLRAVAFMFHGVKGNKAFRKAVMQRVDLSKGRGARQLIEEAMALVPTEALDERPPTTV